MTGLAAWLVLAAAGSPLSLRAAGDPALMTALVHVLEGTGCTVVSDAPVLVTLIAETPTRMRVEARRGARVAEQRVDLGRGPTFERARTLALHCLALLQEVESMVRIPSRRPAPIAEVRPASPPAPVAAQPRPSPLVFPGVMRGATRVVPSPSPREPAPRGTPLHAVGQEPELLEPIAPEWIREHYPRQAQLAAVESTAWVALVLDTHGAVVDAVLVDVQRAGFGFEAAALELATRLRFSPAFTGRTPVATRVVVTIRFELP